MDALTCLKTRRSIRKYEPRQIAAAELDEILEAGTYAPTGMGKQSPVIVAVQDPETIAVLKALNNRISGRKGDPFYGAPTVLAVLADETVPFAVYDGSLVLGNLLNAAHAVGVGSCWIHRAREVFEMPEGKALLRKWGLPETLVGVGHCILGYPAESPSPLPRKTNYIVRV